MINERCAQQSALVVARQFYQGAIYEVLSVMYHFCFKESLVLGLLASVSFLISRALRHMRVKYLQRFPHNSLPGSYGTLHCYATDMLAVGLSSLFC
ncbi:hypothetical protein ZEAMMB73_Zm00001d005310 [Zea mays]|uniref:Uncharacterized protein n=1 Tax=Zea mays TaxID=4577 RepID=A0A1D6ELR4_MAIZE|nr:hypothetical protein ZEAMMB73_Zm00001d005310 [Zea mays]